MLKLQNKENIMAKFNEKNFGPPPEKAYDIKKLVSESEQILWQGHPNRKAFILSKILQKMPIALIWLTIDLTFILLMASTGAFENMPVGLLIFIIIFFALHLIPVWAWIGNIVTASIEHKNTEYVFTNTRIIIKSGVIGIDVKNIYYADINSVNLKVGLIDKLCKVGDIYISGASKAQVLWDIDNPYEITTKLQKIVNDIKTDTYYPNELRPDLNRGYATKYDPKK